MGFNFYQLLEWLSLAVPFLVAVSLGVVLPWILVYSYTNFRGGLAITCACFLADALTMGFGGFTLRINLFYPDLGLVPLACIASMRLLFARDFPSRFMPWMAFCALVILSIAIGLLKYGTAAGVQARPYFYFVATGLYAMSFPADRNRVRDAMAALFVVAACLAALTVYRWVVYYTPMPDLLPPGGVYNVDGPIRVIKSMEALVLAEVVVCAVFIAPGWPGLQAARVMAPVLLALVVLLQHRSVWLAAMCGVLARLVVVRSRASSGIAQAAGLLALLVLMAVPAAFSERLSEVSSEVANSASRALHGADTTAARLNNWKATVRDWSEGGPRVLAIGKGFGGDSSRLVEGVGAGGLQKVTFFAHNMYVQTLYNSGLAGLAALLATMLYVSRGLYREVSRGGAPPEVQALALLIVMQWAYYVPYGTDYLQSLLFGVALAYVAGRKASLPEPFGATAEAHA